jgi:hypothetical protein
MSRYKYFYNYFIRTHSKKFTKSEYLSNSIINFKIIIKTIMYLLLFNYKIYYIDFMHSSSINVKYF